MGVALCNITEHLVLCRTVGTQLWPAQLDFTVGGTMSDPLVRPAEPRRSTAGAALFSAIQRFLTICVRRARGQTTAAAAGGAIFGDFRRFVWGPAVQIFVWAPAY